MREDSQKCVLKELMDLIGLMMLGGFFSSAVEFGEELEMSIKKKKKKQSNYQCHKKQCNYSTLCDSAIQYASKNADILILICRF